MDFDDSKSREKIAIVGMACRLPGASSPDAFWSLIQSGEKAISPVPEERWSLAQGLNNDTEFAGSRHAWRGGFLENITDLDWLALRLNPREAKGLDPQQRLLLELTWEAMENAGIPVTPENRREKGKTGVFVGVQWNDYFRLLCRNWQALDGYTVIGNDSLFASNRLSFLMDLVGPSETINSGCASGLIALQKGCQAIWAGNVEQAVVGAVDLMLAPESQHAMSATGMLSKQGMCRPLDNAADGFVRGEGCVVLVLKPFSQVRSDERVHALVGGIDSTHCGRSDWIMAASKPAQIQVLNGAAQQAGIETKDLDYIELHGTGSLRGDPVEIEALAEATAHHLNQKPNQSLLPIGSVKGQIGHLGPVAGLAGVLKVILGMQHKTLPASIVPENENPALELAQRGFTPYRGGDEWAYDANSRRKAGVTALSLGGISAHAIIEEAPESLKSKTDKAEAVNAERNKKAAQNDHLLLPISARTSNALQNQAKAYITQLETISSKAELTDFCYTACHGRSHHEYRIAATGYSAAELIEQIKYQISPEQTLVVANPDSVVISGVALSAELRQRCEGAGLNVCSTDQLKTEAKRILALASPSQQSQFSSLNGDIEFFDLDETEQPVMAFWARAYCCGARLNFSHLVPEGNIISIPAYAWDKRRSWPKWLTPELIGTPPQVVDAQTPATSTSVDTSTNNHKNHLILGEPTRVAGMDGMFLWQLPVSQLIGLAEEKGDGAQKTLGTQSILMEVAEKTGLSQSNINAPSDIPTEALQDILNIQLLLKPSGNGKSELSIYGDKGDGQWHPLQTQAGVENPEQQPEIDHADDVIFEEFLPIAEELQQSAEPELIMLQYVQELLLRVLQPEDENGALLSTLPKEASPIDLGIDSISAVEFKTLVREDLQLELAVSSIFDAQTIGELATQILAAYQSAQTLQNLVGGSGLNQETHNDKNNEEPTSTDSDELEVLTF